MLFTQWRTSVFFFFLYQDLTRLATELEGNNGKFRQCVV